MRISSEAWAKYQRAHAMLQGEAKQLLEEFFDSLPWDEDERGCLALLAQRAVELFNHYGLADATLSAAFYDEVMEMQGANVPQAVIPEHDMRFVERDVRGACERAKTRETAKSMSSAALSGHVKRAGVETMRTNAVRDRAMWAWVCIGDSCAFCRTLGSNGWQQASKAVLAGRHAEHIHDNCDCQFVVKRPGETLDIEGYDPDALRREYEYAGGKTSKDVINAMRRADYTPEKAAERNARRRELYAAEKAATQALTADAPSIGVEIDELVPCLRRRSDGEIVETYVTRVSGRDLRGYNKSSGWFVDWSTMDNVVMPDHGATEIYRLSVKGSDEPQGLVAIARPGSSGTYPMGMWAVANPKSQASRVGKENKEYDGIGGHLFAVMCEKSMEWGYDGELDGFAKTSKLLEYYLTPVEEGGMGGTWVGDLKFYIDEESARKLIELYNYERR